MASPNLTAIAKVAKLSPNIISILGCNPGKMTLRGTNTYIIGNGKRRILLDTGDGLQPEYISNLLESLSFNKITIKEIILSHWHHDHVGGTSEILKNAEKNCVVHKFSRKDGKEPYEPFNQIKDGQTFDLEGGLTLKAFHTPGHTTDSIILHLLEENAVFSADTILGEGTAVFEDLYDYMQSLERILSLKPSVIYPGHGPVISDPMERIHYYISHRHKREQQILEVLNSKSGQLDFDVWTPMDIVKVVYTDTPESLHVAAAMNVKHHLTKLVKEGKAQRDGDNYFV